MTRWVLAVLLIPTLLHASEYYVAVGGDGPVCAEADPCGSMATALSLAGEDDEIYIHAGVYAEVMTGVGTLIFSGDSWAEKMVIAAYGDGTVTFRPGSGSDEVLFLGDGDAKYLEFVDINFDGTGTTAASVIKITCSGANCNETGLNSSNHIRFIGGSVTGGPNNGILITGDGSTHNEFLGVRIYNNGDFANTEHGLYISGDDNLVENCLIHDNAAVGIHIYNGVDLADADRNVVRGNHIYNNGTAGNYGDGILVGGEDNVIELNYVHHNPTGDGIRVYDKETTPIVNSVDNIIRNNWVYLNDTAHESDQVSDSVTATGTVITNTINAPPSAAHGGSVSLSTTRAQGNVKYAY